MSYCVNCGVELQKSEPRCPLCGTEVVNPNEAGEENPPARTQAMWNISIAAWTGVISPRLSLCCCSSRSSRSCLRISS